MVKYYTRIKMFELEIIFIISWAEKTNEPGAKGKIRPQNWKTSLRFWLRRAMIDVSIYRLNFGIFLLNKYKILSITHNILEPR
jgi:hypothetical protein